MSLANNIYYLYIIKFSKWFMLYMPIIGLFYADHGLHPADLFILQSGYSFASAIFEIPSGYLADVVGRKKTLVLGSTLGALGFSVYVFFSGFWFFLCAEVIMGIGQSFISGSDSAMLYDTLRESGRKNMYVKHEGVMSSFGGFAETIAAVIGGFIAVLISLNSVFVFQVFIAACAIPAALLLVEPQRKKRVQEKSFSDIVSISLYALFGNKKLRNAILLSSIIGVATLTMAWAIQAYIVDVSMTEKTSSILWVALNGTVAFVSLFAAFLLFKYGLHKLLLVLIVVIPLTYIIMGVAPFMIVIGFLFIFYAVRGYATPLLKDLIQQNCESDIRATVLSIRGLLIRMSFGVLAPVIGVMINLVSLQFAMISIGGFFILTIGSIYFLYVTENLLHKTDVD